MTAEFYDAVDTIADMLWREELQSFERDAGRGFNDRAEFVDLVESSGLYNLIVLKTRGDKSLINREIEDLWEENKCYCYEEQEKEMEEEH